MSQTRQGGSNAGQHLGDTTYTKIFVGGLAWETHRETMRRYFEQFGEIQEAVVITDKNTGRSKGYGFVTFKDPNAAMRACQDPSPVIDGRRANCNLASLGANRPPSSAPLQVTGMGQHRPGTGCIAPSFTATPTYYSQTAPYPWYSVYCQENLYPMSYYNAYGGNQFSPLYTGASTGMFPGYYPYYAQYPQASHAQSRGFGMQYLLPYAYMPQQYNASGIMSVPPSSPVETGAGLSDIPGSGSSAQSGTENGQREHQTPSREI